MSKTAVTPLCVAGTNPSVDTNMSAVRTGSYSKENYPSTRGMTSMSVQVTKHYASKA
jgi:hypothetical protein